jgi:hypothetical protein
MLISDSHEFIFLRMRKVASTSMKLRLLPLCIPRPESRIAHLKSRVKLEWDYHKYLPRSHETIVSVQRRMPVDRFQRYFKFAFVRNPWDRLVSEYEFLLERPEHARHSRVKKLANFEQFIHMQIPRKDAYQINTLCNRKGEYLMDFVGKLENLQNDWETVCKRIGIDHEALPRRNATEARAANAGRRFQDYYDKSSRDLVARHWAREIEMFDYHFNDSC